MSQGVTTSTAQSSSGQASAASTSPEGGTTAAASAPEDGTPCTSYVYSGGVEVWTDEYGHPHYKLLPPNNNQYDVYFAVGYDHMWRYPVSTAYHLRLASGDLAPRLGLPWLNKDLSMRHWHVEETAKAYLPCPVPAPDFEWRMALAAYVAGVNAGRELWNMPGYASLIALKTEPLSLTLEEIERLLGDQSDPAEAFQEWQVVAWALVQQNNLPLAQSITDIASKSQLGSETGGNPDWGPATDAYDPYRLIPGAGQWQNIGECPPPQPASNSWALHSSITDGGPIVVSDPHLPTELYCDEWNLPQMLEIWSIAVDENYAASLIPSMNLTPRMTSPRS